GDLNSVDGGAQARDHTDEADRSAHPDGRERAVQVLAADHLDHVIDAATACQGEDLLLPGRHPFVVDGAHGAHAPGFFELLVATRKDDRLTTQGVDELHGEDRHAAGPLDEDVVAALDAAATTDRVPGRHGRIGERRRLHVPQMTGNPHDGLLVEDPVLRQNAV